MVKSQGVARFLAVSGAVLLSVVACTPLGDLDATASGSGGKLVGAGGVPVSSATGGTSSSGGAAGTGSTRTPAMAGAASTGGESSGGTSTATLGSGGEPPTAGSSASGGLADSATGGAGAMGGTAGESGVPSTSGGTAGSVGASPASGGSAGFAAGGVGGGAGASTGGAVSTAPELPNDLPNSPVRGDIMYSADAIWMVDGVAEPTFEIHTPTASYWLVKSTASIVSITDAKEGDQRQWIGYSSDFRPLRGVPVLGSLPRMTTVQHEPSQTPTHLRLECRSAARDWQLVWDFYLSHVTLTVNRAPRPYSFAYRGVPGGDLDDMDRLVLSSGSSQSAKNSYGGELPGPFEWAYLVDTRLGRSLFMIQHGDDDLSERYQVKDNDSALLSFGDGMLSRTPLRFSLGLIESSVHATVKARVEFVTTSIR